MRKLRSGLTLLELLVVVVIVTLLTALVIPAVLRTRESARNTQCLNNLRQITLGFRLYADLNQDRFPDEKKNEWFLEIAPHLELQEDVFHCPANPVQEDFGYQWRENTALFPSARVAKRKFSSVLSKEIILVFDHSDSWHAPNRLNAAVVNGGVRSFTVEEFEENMLLDVTTGTITLN